MNVLDSAVDKYASIQNGLAVGVKTLQEKPDLVKKLLRAKSKAARYFEQNEREVSEMLAKMWNTDLATALESYRLIQAGIHGDGHSHGRRDQGISASRLADSQITAARGSFQCV